MIVKDYPLLVLGSSFVGLMLAAKIGDTLRIRVRALQDEDRDDFRIVLGATLTMLGLLRKYVNQRISFYTTRDPEELAKINTDTAELQDRLWATVRAAAVQPTPLVALAVSGMNDVLNSQGYTQAAWWNRIPRSAWALMVAIAVCSNMLIGYGARRTDWRVFLILPVAVSIAFFLISDMDSPRGGAIRVAPQNLFNLAGSLRAP